MARDSLLEGLENPELIVQVHDQNQPNLDSALRVARRMKVVFQTVLTRASTPVHVVSEGPVGPVAQGEVRDPWVAQLAKAIQQLNWLLDQGKMTGPEPGPTVVDNGQQGPKAEKREGRSYGQEALLKLGRCTKSVF